MIEPEKIAVAGDWHGNTAWAVQMIAHAARMGADTIVHLGDFGFWRDDTPGNYYLERVEDKLNELGVTLYWVDGNHEDYERIARQLPGRELTIMADYPHIIHLPRGFRWNWRGQTWMALGGAHSVDRHLRVEGKSWWPGEILSDEDIAYASREGNVDIIVAHDAPYGVDIPGIGTVANPKGFPVRAIAASENHRQRVREVFDAVQPALFLHGHYHRNYRARLNSALVIGLDCDGTSVADNVLLLDPP